MINLSDIFDPKDLLIGALFYLDTQGNSMRGLIKPGDVLVAKRVEPRDLIMGDLVVFRLKGEPVCITHRLVFKKKKDKRCLFIFKGDDANCFDTPVFEEDVIGKILQIQRKGFKIKLDSVKGKIISWRFFLNSLFGFFSNKSKENLRRVLSRIKDLMSRIRNLSFAIVCRLRYLFSTMISRLKYLFPTIVSRLRYLFSTMISRLKYLFSPGVVKRSVQDFVLKTNRMIILRDIYCIYYILAIKFFLLFPLRYRHIKSIYLRRQMVQGNFCPGASDIDVTVIIKERGWEEEASFLKSFWKGYFLLKRVLPVLGEVEILTEEELKNWALVGGIRIWEVMSWRKLYGKEVRSCDNIVPSPDSLKLAYLSEAMQSFWVLSMDISGKRKDDLRRYEYRKFFNRLVDTLKFIDKIFNDAVSDDRQEFIANFITQHKESLFGKELAKFVGKVMNNVPKIENEMLINIYSHLIYYLNSRCQVINQSLLSCAEEVRNGRFMVKTLNKKIDINDGKLDRLWQESVSGLLASCGNDILSILSNSHVFTSHIFVVLKQDLDMERIKEVCKQTFATLLDWVPAIVTKDTLQCMCYSLFLESSFNYWHIIEQANIDFGADPKNYLTRPADDIVLSMLKKNAGAFNLCFRMFAINRTPECLLYHSIDQIIRLHLAMDRGIIVSSLKDAINEYKIHYKESNSNLVYHLEKYLTLNRKELNELSNEEIFYENFEFIREEMTRLNNLINNERS